MSHVYSQTLRRAAEIAGGVHALSKRLGLSQSELLRWMGGIHRAPDDVFLRAVDIIAAHSLAEMSKPDSPVAEVSPAPAEAASPPPFPKSRTAKLRPPD